MFGDGKLCACKIVSGWDLPSFILDYVVSEDKINQVFAIGGSGKALTPLEQGEMYRIVGKNLTSSADRLRYYGAESVLILDSETGEYNADKTPSYRDSETGEYNAAKTPSNGKDTLEGFFEREY